LLGHLVQRRDHGYRGLQRARYNLAVGACEQRIVEQVECAHLGLAKAGKGDIEVALGARLDEDRLQAERRRSEVEVLRDMSGIEEPEAIAALPVLRREAAEGARPENSAMRRVE